jgi:hypothetical protein
MPSEPRNITLERVNRLTQAVADLTESHATQGRGIIRLLEQIGEHLSGIDTKLAAMSKDVNSLATEQIILGNRVEDALTRALRANIRVDEIEDDKP